MQAMLGSTKPWLVASTTRFIVAMQIRHALAETLGARLDVNRAFSMFSCRRCLLKVQEQTPSCAPFRTEPFSRTLRADGSIAGTANRSADLRVRQNVVGPGRFACGRCSGEHELCSAAATHVFQSLGRVQQKVISFEALKPFYIHP